MPEVPIQPKDRFSFTRLPRRGRSERAHLGNFEGVSPLPGRGDVLFYNLFPSGDQPDGGDSRDRVEVFGVDRYQARLNEITRSIVEMSRQPSETSPSQSTAGGERGKYLNVMYIAFGTYTSRAAD